MIAACLLLALTGPLGGCRKSQPLAPKAEVDGILSNLGIYCGEASELAAYGRPARLGALDQKATVSARHLIRIMRSAPEATYLGQSMRRVVSTAASETSECHLSHASSELSSSLGEKR